MTKTHYKALQEALRTAGRYETPPEARPRRPARKSALHSIRCAKVVALDIVGRCCCHYLRGVFDYEKWAQACMASIHFAEGIGSVVTFEGFGQRAAHDGPVVYVSNHMSTFETMVYPAALTTFGKIAIILKKSLTDIPVVGPTARAVGCIAVTRKNARDDLKAVLEQGAVSIANGLSVLIFPQGTRQPVFESRRFNSLGAKLAERASVPLVPIAVQSDFLEVGKWRWLRDFGAVDPSRPVRFACGPVLAPDLGGKKMHEQSVAFIAGKLAAWGLPSNPG
ncbi:MAG: 1-acyl-sn-glycerol-3-phosphate acyltransferase [Kiritimatiellaeota bacterium]|nr:1-acyl-sn-glycerol-3-phosphate acyltransferase [Kiritimatiellota bacterium]